MSGKDRVYVALYTHPVTPDIESTTTASSIPSSKAARFHWGIWIEPKGSAGEGTSIDIEDTNSNTVVSNLFGGRLRIIDHKATPPSMLGRLMIGKIPEDATSRDVIDLLSQIPLPGDPGSLIMNGIEWIKAAISELQRTGCAESFYVEGFVKEAYSSAKKWESSNRSKGPKKVNYTRSRTFP